MAAGLSGGSSGQQPRVRKQKVRGAVTAACRGRSTETTGAQRPQVRNSQQAGIEGKTSPRSWGLTWLQGNSLQKPKARSESPFRTHGGPASQALPASVGDTGLIPGLGRSHKPQGN